jgi:hypothetical protein
VGLEEKKQLVLVHFCLLFPFTRRNQSLQYCIQKSTLPKSSLLHLTGQPYWKKNRSAKGKDGIITYFLGTISLVDTPWQEFTALE